MTNRNLIITLGKVIVAAAWADGEISRSEVNSLKDLLFQLPALTEQQWAELDMYIETPVDETERQQLLTQLRQEIASAEDKQLALSALDTMIEADGEITEEERAFAERFQAMIDSVDTGLFANMNRLLRGPVQRRQAIAGTRDQYFDDFIRNKVYYGVRRRLDSGADSLDLPDATLRKMSLAGALLATVARASQGIAATEFEAIVAALQSTWGVGSTEATIIAEVATDAASAELDLFRVAREFVQTFEYEQRVTFLDALFAVALADGFVAADELDAIDDLTRRLMLPNDCFITAKLKVPREQRAG